MQQTVTRIRAGRGFTVGKAYQARGSGSGAFVVENDDGEAWGFYYASDHGFDFHSRTASEQDRDDARRHCRFILENGDVACRESLQNAATQIAKYMEAYL